ncbi:MAG: glycosyltransferase family 87 protein [Bacteroidota bacterium]
MKVLKILIALYLIITIAITFQSFALGPKTFLEDGEVYTHYNNYIIFKQSFFHLIENKDLYILYPEEHWDLYKYSPTFPLFFSVFAVLPDTVGLGLWNLLNMLLFVAAVYFFPKLDHRQKIIVLLTSFLAATSSTQNAQCNVMISGLLMIAFTLMERGKAFWAIFCLVATVYIKIFGIVGFSMLLFYPDKLRYALYAVFWTVIFLLLPLLVISPEQLQFLYSSWGNMLFNDHSASYGYSVMGWLYNFLGLDASKTAVVLAGVLLYLAPLAQFRKYKYFYFKALVLCMTLIWVVIFNHKSEGATFILPVVGVALWYALSPKTTINHILFGSVVLLTVISPTDLFPRFLRQQYLLPYSFNIFPCILVWLKIIWDLFTVPLPDTSP